MSADDNAPEQAREVEVVAREHDFYEEVGGYIGCSCGWPDRSEDDHMESPVLHIWGILAPIRAAERQEAAREAWDAGYETGRDDECFDQRGLSTDSDAHEYPHANPYRADGATTPTIPADTTDHGQQEMT